MTKTNENIDQTILDTQAKLAEKFAEIAQKESEIPKNWKTLGKVTFNGRNLVLSIASLEDVKGFVEFLVVKQANDQKVADILSLKPDDSFQNFSYNDWFEDCRKRASTLSLKEEKVKLNKLASRLENIESPGIKRQKELSSILDGFAD